jgi:hypothetical protein
MYASPPGKPGTVVTESVVTVANRWIMDMAARRAVNGMVSAVYFFHHATILRADVMVMRCFDIHVYFFSRLIPLDTT